MKVLLVFVIFSVQIVWTRDERSYLDNFIEPFRAFRLLTSDFIQQSNSRNLRQLKNNPRLQNEISEDVLFPCSLKNARSPQRPTNVNQIRPGDIDVIGALGDSLTAGFGLLSTSLAEILLENRGASFSGGGEKTWREYLTLPNILKMFNPNLIGFSLGTFLSIQRGSQFNVAEGGAISENTPYMAKVLIKRIQKDPRVDLNRDWKMITYLIGDNDFCSEMCYGKSQDLLRQHEYDLVTVLRLLRDNLPRTIVNVIPPPHLKILVDMTKRPDLCAFIFPAWCPCLFPDRKGYYDHFMRKWQELDVEIVNRPEFDRSDFTAVLQPFTLNYSFPTLPGGDTDYNYLSHDCFHFSQKGGARVANDLWNNLMEPVGRKAMDGNNFFQKFNCPSEENPYIFTRKNSRIF